MTHQLEMPLAPQDVKQVIPDGEPNTPSLTTFVQYVYKPLQEVDEIRLLRIEPGSWESSPQCTLSHHRLPQCPPFEALSYVWGSEEKPCKIDCGESGSLAVTRSCFAAIKRLRKLCSLVVWIDAVCIDQDNDLERGHQVKNMPDIYKEAAKVVVYLGEAEDHGDEAMETLRLYKWKLSTYLSPLRKLMQRPWFERLWVLQEVNKAQTLTVVCGDRVVPWDPYIRRLVELGPEHSVQMEFPYTLQIRGYNQNTLQSRDLFEMLENTRPYKCTDPRDRIFALLSMCSEDSRHGIEPDYTTTVEEVYTRAATRFLQRIGLDVLAMVDHGDRELPKTLPSWVPDWKTRPSCTPLIKALSCRTDHSGVMPYFSVRNSKLLVHGHPFGTIHDHGLGRDFELDDSGWDKVCVDDWWRNLSQQCPDARSEDLIRILRMSTSDNSDLFTPFRKTLRSLVQSIAHTVLRIVEIGEERQSTANVELRPDYPELLCSNAFFDLLEDPQLTTTSDSDFFLASEGSDSLQGDYRKHGLALIKLYKTRFEQVSYSEISRDLKYVLLDEIHRRGLREYQPSSRDKPFPFPTEAHWPHERVNRSFRGKPFSSPTGAHRPQERLPPTRRILLHHGQERVEPQKPQKTEKYKAIKSLVETHICRQMEKFQPKDIFYGPSSGSMSSVTLERIVERNWDLAKPEKRSLCPDQVTSSMECHFLGPQTIHECCNGRRLFVTEHFTGLVPANAQRGDILCTCTGTKFPILLRKADGHEVFIGACYVIGDIESQVQCGRYFTII